MATLAMTNRQVRLAARQDILFGWLGWRAAGWLGKVRESPVIGAIGPLLQKDAHTAGK